MKILIPILLLLLISTHSLAETNVEFVRKDGSDYNVFVNDELATRHTTWHKASQSAIEKALACQDCTVEIRQALLIAVTVRATESTPPKEYTMRATWTRPINREDGTLLLPNELSHYELTIDGSPPITVDITYYSTSLTLSPGVHEAAVRAIDSSGIASKWGITTFEV